MPAVRAQVILKTASQVPADYVTNSWCFEGVAPFNQQAAVTTLLKNFYDVVKTNIGLPSLAQNGHEVKWYDLPGVTPNYPFATTTFNFATSVTGDPFASEVAQCLSFQGLKTPGFPQNRRRGRLYLGPVRSDLSVGGRPLPASMTAITGAASTLKTALAALSPAVTWCVWSQTDGAAVPVANGWMDNAFDIQRRRGIVPTSRTTFT